MRKKFKSRKLNLGIYFKKIVPLLLDMLSPNPCLSSKLRVIEFGGKLQLVMQNERTLVILPKKKKKERSLSNFY